MSETASSIAVSIGVRNEKKLAKLKKGLIDSFQVVELITKIEESITNVNHRIKETRYDKQWTS